VIQLGRHSGIDLICTSQRIQDVSKRLTSQVDEFIIFRMAEPRDLDEIEKRFGPETSDRVRNLKAHEHINIIVGEGVKENADRDSGSVGVAAGSVSSEGASDDYIEVASPDAG
jgi:DNA helicase HerA-like ATPase